RFSRSSPPCYYICFLFSSTPRPPTALVTLSLHDALPIFVRGRIFAAHRRGHAEVPAAPLMGLADGCVDVLVVHGRQHQLALVLLDRKSTRLNSSHGTISYAVFCLKKKKKPPLVYCL